LQREQVPAGFLQFFAASACFCMHFACVFSSGEPSSGLGSNRLGSNRVWPRVQ
jgi:hypothetical protein